MDGLLYGVLCVMRCMVRFSEIQTHNKHEPPAHPVWVALGAVFEGLCVGGGALVISWGWLWAGATLSVFDSTVLSGGCVGILFC